MPRSTRPPLSPSRLATWQVAFREVRHVASVRVLGLPVRVVIPSPGADEYAAALAELAAAHEPADLHRRGFRLYEMFRPGVPAGESGWGAKGELDLDRVRSMAGKAQD